MLIVCAAALPARAQDEPKEAPKLAEDIHETIAKVPVTVPLAAGARHSGHMIVTHYRPEGAGPFPVVIFNHGRTSRKSERALTARHRYVAVARYFVRRGFAVFVPTRIGYGDAGVDTDPEATRGACSARDYRPVMEAMVVQSVAALDFAKTLPWVDGRRVVLAGQSYGGLATIAASADRQIGALAAINFAGGGGGNRKKIANPCGPLQVGAAIADRGKQAKIPTLWLYAENDKLWGADWPRVWHEAYVKGGGKAEMIMFPPVGDDGHSLIAKGFRQWRPVTDRFLEKAGFPPPRTAEAPKASDFAKLEETDRIPYIKESARSEGYEKFLDADLPRAFVVSTAGGWAWRSGNEAAMRALEWCREKSKGSCHLYAVDDAVVFQPPVSAGAIPRN